MLNFGEMSNEQIRKMLIKASNSYYNKSESIISDEEYDYLFKTLKQRNPEDPFFKTIGSPVPKSTGWVKEAHKIPMGSLDKVNTEEEFRKWCKKIIENTFIMQWKLDGISLEINYENGKFVSGISRGDGFVGENFSPNVSKMINVKKELPNNFTGSLRGEIILTAENFEFINDILRENDEKEFKNLRNAASGIAKGFDGRFCEYLSVIFYDCSGEFKSEFEKIDYISNVLCLEIVKSVICNSVDECIEQYKLFENIRNDLNFDADGIVIRINSISKQNELGIKDGIPKGQIAWKFKSIEKIAKVKNVTWEYGVGGTLTPVIHIEPTKIGGITVSKMTCFNLNQFSNLKLYENCNLLFKRANDVVPIPISVVEEN